VLDGLALVDETALSRRTRILEPTNALGIALDNQTLVARGLPGDTDDLPALTDRADEALFARNLAPRLAVNIAYFRDIVALAHLRAGHAKRLDALPLLAPLGRSRAAGHVVTSKALPRVFIAVAGRAIARTQTDVCNLRRMRHVREVRRFHDFHGFKRVDSIRNPGLGLSRFRGNINNLSAVLQNVARGPLVLAPDGANERNQDDQPEETRRGMHVHPPIS